MSRWFRMPRFLRQFIRRRTKEISFQTAESKKHKLSLVYAFCAWNLFCILAYKSLISQRGEMKEENEISQGRYFIKLLNLKNVELYRVSGISSIQYVDTKQEIEEEATTAETSNGQEISKD